MNLSDDGHKRPKHRHTVYIINIRTLLFRINWDSKLSGYAENLDKWIVFESRLHWQFEVRLLLFTVCTASQHFDHAGFEVLVTITLYCT